MQENILRNPILLLKRYWLLIIVFVIAGNLIVWKKYKTDVPGYEYVVKLRVKGQYYDKTKSFSTSISDSSNWKSSNIFNLDTERLSRLISIKTDSYRNEDVYIFDFVFFFKDTTGFLRTIDSIYTFIKEKSFLKTHYFNRIAMIDDLLTEGDQVLKRSSIDTSLYQTDILFDIKYKRFELLNFRESLLREFDIMFPSFSEVHFTQVKTFRSYLVNTILFLIFGIFISIIIDQLRLKPHSH